MDNINYYFLIMYLDSLGGSLQRLRKCRHQTVQLLNVPFSGSTFPADVLDTCVSQPLPLGRLGLAPLPRATVAPHAVLLLDRMVPASFLLHLPSMFCVPGRWALVDFPLCSVVTHSIASLWFLLFSSILNMSNCLTRIILLPQGLRDECSFELNWPTLPIASVLD